MEDWVSDVRVMMIGVLARVRSPAGGVMLSARLLSVWLLFSSGEVSGVAAEAAPLAARRPCTLVGVGNSRCSSNLTILQIEILTAKVFS